jgi:hypothetical protein
MLPSLGQGGLGKQHRKIAYDGPQFSKKRGQMSTPKVCALTPPVRFSRLVSQAPTLQRLDAVPTHDSAIRSSPRNRPRLF